MTVIESTVVTKPTYRVVVALRDGFYGASSGSGFSNRDFLIALTRLLPPGCLVVMPSRIQDVTLPQMLTIIVWRGFGRRSTKSNWMHGVKVRICILLHCRETGP
ncbi:hypothetical protein GCM10009733_092590 [Nonomuraea maheshkhaliensis]|uniref:Uncharacterized protein n=1 Tax=Nonomuraea maheshkhaliensis TaxID=419590 RepID=A0ABN2H3G8_9ACTN